MNRKIAITGTAALALVLGTALAGCSGAAPAPTTDPGGTDPGASGVDPRSPEQTRITTQIFQGSIDLAVWEARDIAAEQYGVDITVDWMTDSAAARSQLAAGTLTALPTAGNTVYDMVNGGVDVRIVAPSHFQTDSTVTVEALDDSIQSMCDLEGKTVGAVTLTGLYPNRVKAAIQADGCDFNNVNFVQVPYGEMAAALQQGIVQAAVTQGLAQFQSRDIGSHQIYDLGGGSNASRIENVWIMTADFVAKNPNTVAAFQCALEQGAEIGSDREVVEAFMRDELGWSNDVIAASPSVKFARGSVDPASLDADLQDRITIGEIPAGSTFDWAKYIVPMPDNC